MGWWEAWRHRKRSGRASLGETWRLRVTRARDGRVAAELYDEDRGVSYVGAAATPQGALDDLRARHGIDPAISLTGVTITRSVQSDVVEGRRSDVIWPA